MDVIDEDQLAAALGLRPREVVSLVGGGGKTSSMFAIARSLPAGALITTTTKMGAERTGGFPVLVAPTDDQVRAETAHRSVLVWGGASEKRAVGVPPSQCDRWSGFVDQVLVEADGSRGRPFKSPESFEPVIPQRTSLVINCLGVAALGQTISDVCFRPDRVAAVAGCGEWDRLTPARAAAVLLDRRGGRKGIPALARQAIVVTGVTQRTTHHFEELSIALGDDVTVLAVAPNGRTRADAPDLDHS